MLIRKVHLIFPLLWTAVAWLCHGQDEITSTVPSYKPAFDMTGWELQYPHATPEADPPDTIPKYLAAATPARYSLELIKTGKINTTNAESVTVTFRYWINWSNTILPPPPIFDDSVKVYVKICDTESDELHHATLDETKKGQWQDFVYDVNFDTATAETPALRCQEGNNAEGFRLVVDTFNGKLKDVFVAVKDIKLEYNFKLPPPPTTTTTTTKKPDIVVPPDNGVPPDTADKPDSGVPPDTSEKTKTSEGTVAPENLKRHKRSPEAPKDEVTSPIVYECKPDNCAAFKFIGQEMTWSVRNKPAYSENYRYPTETRTTLEIKMKNNATLDTTFTLRYYASENSSISISPVPSTHADAISVIQLGPTVNDNGAIEWVDVEVKLSTLVPQWNDDEEVKLYLTAEVPDPNDFVAVVDIQASETLRTKLIQSVSANGIQKYLKNWNKGLDKTTQWPAIGTNAGTWTVKPATFMLTPIPNFSAGITYLTSPWFNYTEVNDVSIPINGLIELQNTTLATVNSEVFFVDQNFQNFQACSTPVGVNITGCMLESNNTILGHVKVIIKLTYEGFNGTNAITVKDVDVSDMCVGEDGKDSKDAACSKRGTCHNVGPGKFTCTCDPLMTWLVAETQCSKSNPCKLPDKKYNDTICEDRGAKCKHDENYLTSYCECEQKNGKDTYPLGPNEKCREMTLCDKVICGANAKCNTSATERKSDAEMCQCLPDHEKDGNSNSCRRTDPCTKTPCDNGKCVTVGIEGKCVCGPNDRLTTDGLRCVPGCPSLNCEHACEEAANNTICKCNDGYNLEGTSKCVANRTGCTDTTCTAPLTCVAGKCFCPTTPNPTYDQPDCKTDVCQAVDKNDEAKKKVLQVCPRKSCNVTDGNKPFPESITCICESFETLDNGQCKLKNPCEVNNTCAENGGGYCVPVKTTTDYYGECRCAPNQEPVDDSTGTKICVDKCQAMKETCTKGNAVCELEFDAKTMEFNPKCVCPVGFIRSADGTSCVISAKPYVFDLIVKRPPMSDDMPSARRKRSLTSSSLKSSDVSDHCATLSPLQQQDCYENVEKSKQNRKLVTDNPVNDAKTTLAKELRKNIEEAMRNSMSAIAGYEDAKIIDLTLDGNDYKVTIGLDFKPGVPIDPKALKVAVDCIPLTAKDDEKDCLILPKLFSTVASHKAMEVVQKEWCSSELHGCSPGAVCEPTPEGYQCICPKKGFSVIYVTYNDGEKKMRKEVCEDKDECKENPKLCGGHTCVNTLGSFTCSCNDGFKTFNQTSCIGVCEGADCGHGKCHPNGNTHRCHCDDGYAGGKCDVEDGAVIRWRTNLTIVASVLSVLCVVIIIISVVIYMKRRSTKSHDSNLADYPGYRGGQGQMRREGGQDNVGYARD